VISLDRAATLLAQLARCDFPFVCAHGRQSLAVLAQL
jgi:DNA mismatch repair ATPase MutL